MSKQPTKQTRDELKGIDVIRMFKIILILSSKRFQLLLDTGVNQDLCLPKIVKKVDTENRMMFTRRWREGKWS